MSLCFFIPPFPSYHIISPQLCFPLAKLKTMLLWRKYTNAKVISIPLGPKQVLFHFLQRLSKDQPLLRMKIYVFVSPMKNTGGLDETDAWTI